MRPTAWLGIDPGKSGAAALLTEPNRSCIGEGISFYDFEDPPTAADYLRAWKSDFRIMTAVLEKVHAMPKQGVSSCFTFGANFGMWEGILCALSIPYRLVTPQKWQKGMFTKADGPTPEKRALKAARGMFPHAELHLVKHKDRACALLMAYFAKTKC